MLLVSTVLGNSQGPQNVERVIVQDFTFFCMFGED